MKKTISDKCPATHPSFLFRFFKIFGLVFLSVNALIWPVVFGEETKTSGWTEPGTDLQSGQQAGVSSAQATMASLFGRGAVMPVPPQMTGGTLALPSFDSSNLEIDKETVSGD